MLMENRSVLRRVKIETDSGYPNRPRQTVFIMDLEKGFKSVTTCSFSREHQKKIVEKKKDGLNKPYEYFIAAYHNVVDIINDEEVESYIICDYSIRITFIFDHFKVEAYGGVSANERSVSEIGQNIIEEIFY